MSNFALFSAISHNCHISQKNSTAVSRFLVKSPDSRRNFVFLSEKAFLELSPKVFLYELFLVKKHQHTQIHQLSSIQSLNISTKTRIYNRITRLCSLKIFDDKRALILPNPGSNLDFFLKLKGKFVLLVATLVLNKKCPTFIAFFLASKTNERSKVMFKCEYTNPKIESKLKNNCRFVRR